METVAFDPAMDVLPGPWSPDGKSLVAYVVDREDQDATGMWINGRLWTVDADRAAPLWDSGDMQGPVPDERMAEWRADGTLVLARADGMLVRPDGSEAGEVRGIDLQVREVDVAPDGVTVFANGPEGSWLVDGSGTARGIAGVLKPGIDNWEWRPDSARLATAGSGGRYGVIDVPSATYRPIADSPNIGAGGGRIAAPRWLADGRVLLSDATYVEDAGGGHTEHWIVEPDTLAITRADDLLGVPRGEGVDAIALHWVSPGGRHIVHPEYTSVPMPPPPYPGAATPGPGATMREQRATRIYDVALATSRAIETVQESRWAPAGDRFAGTGPDRRGLWVYDAAAGSKAAIVGPDVTVAWLVWSPDGRWLLFSDDPPNDSIAGLWLAASDGGAAPVRVAGGDGFWQYVTWSPAGDRFAVSVPSAADPVAATATAEAAGTGAGSPGTAPGTSTPEWPPRGSRHLLLVTIQGAAMLEPTTVEPATPEP